MNLPGNPRAALREALSRDQARLRRLLSAWEKAPADPAARAGDAGRGFAVVADEVRKLAEKTMGATREVGETIDAIQGAAQRNMASMGQALDAITRAELIVIAPSNPLLSIEPILAVPGLRAAIEAAAAPVIAVSPLIGGKAVKGPLARLIADLGLEPGAAGIAARYGGLIDGFAVHESDEADIARVRASGMAVLAADILMPGPEAAERLARALLAFAPQAGRRRGGAAS